MHLELKALDRICFELSTHILTVNSTHSGQQTFVIFLFNSPSHKLRFSKNLRILERKQIHRVVGITSHCELNQHLTNLTLSGPKTSHLAGKMAIKLYVNAQCSRFSDTWELHRRQPWDRPPNLRAPRNDYRYFFIFFLLSVVLFIFIGRLLVCKR